MRCFRGLFWASLPGVIGLTMLLLSLASCAPGTTASPPVAQPTPIAIDFRSVCGRLKDYSQAEQSALADALSHLDKNNPIFPAMGDYKRMRDEARACRAKAGK